MNLASDEIFRGFRFLRTISWYHGYRARAIAICRPAGSANVYLSAIFFGWFDLLKISVNEEVVKDLHAPGDEEGKTEQDWRGEERAR